MDAGRTGGRHWLFTGFFTPLSDIIDWAINAVEAVLLWLPWYVLVAIVFLIPAQEQACAEPGRSRRWH